MSQHILTISARAREAFLAKRNELVTAHLGLVRRIAESVARSLPSQFDIDDLVSVGYVGLVHAATQFRPEKHGNAPFDAYARLRIRGAIVDSVRRRHWVENTRASVDSISLADRNRWAEPAAVEDALEAERERAELQAAIARLPARYRRLIKLYYSDGRPTLDVVARKFGVGASRASHLHREALAMLREQLAA